MTVVKFDQIKSVNLNNVRQILVIDEANKFHGPLEIWAVRTLGALVSSDSSGITERREQLLVEVDGEVTPEKLAAIMKILKARETPPADNGFISIHQWEKWGFRADIYPG
ncbi:hypothetical protein CCL16_10380 [Pseudomonas syringae]|uniref:hypothetical protein n=1 Tax=Pseudomonas TaxID=286 RepID=UPI000BB63A9C|nr:MULTISPECIES: hypothetical protein [Pseudomonas]PBP88914.1 hypothetical protein CCL16_10380 [Pseudomonas syringae]